MPNEPRQAFLDRHTANNPHIAASASQGAMALAAVQLPSPPSLLEGVGAACTFSVNVWVSLPCPLVAVIVMLLDVPMSVTAGVPVSVLPASVSQAGRPEAMNVMV